MSLLTKIDLTTVTTPLARKFPFLDSWSAPTNKITISNVAVDLSFPDIVREPGPDGARKLLEAHAAALTHS